MADVWVLGGTGRVGRGVADRLTSPAIEPVLVGRDAQRLREAAGGRGVRSVVAPNLPAMAAAIVEGRPAVVVNTIGAFTRTAPDIVDACLAAGSAYVDLANDLASVPAVLARDPEAKQAGVTLVTGAGFGVVATESLVTWLCADGRRAERVRVDMVPSLALHAGVLGDALAGTLVEGLPGVPGGGRYAGRRIVDSRLAPAPIGGAVQLLDTPDGDRVATGLMPLGELVAAQRASGARFVDSASSEAPHGRLVRVVLPVAARLLAVPAVRRFAGRRLAAVRITDRPAPRAHSWGHATLTWADGTWTEGWLRLGEAQAATETIAAEVARRLADGDGRPGAYTPAALFSHRLASDLGAGFSRTDGGAAQR